MPAYNPPNSHYREIKGIEDKQIMLKIIGKNGCNLKYLTDKTKMQYVWWDQKRNVIELWGPMNKLMNASETIVDFMIEKKGTFMTNFEYMQYDQMHM